MRRAASRKIAWAGVGFLAMTVLIGCGGQAVADEPNAAQRRAAVQHTADQGAAAVPALTTALNDKALLVRRTAVRSLVRIGKPATDALVVALDNDDMLVRRIAVTALYDLLGADALPHLADALEDPSPLVRQRAVLALTSIQPRSEPVTTLLRQAQHDSTDIVRKTARAALWPWHKEARSARERPAFKDHSLHIVTEIPLPTSGWQFRIDPKGTGHLARWFASDFDDGDWKTIEIAQAWEPQGWTDYDGLAWYRRTFRLPEKPEMDGVDLVFGGVDEIAWVWVNGQFVGEHDLGKAGWNKSFAVDVTDVLQWDGTNQIAVRVLDTALAGGIWKPVTIEALAQ